jgi:hypothetical protein
VFPERLIEVESLHPTAVGFATGMRLPWYRALPLSCIERIDVSVDGVAVPPEAVRLRVGRTGPLEVSKLAALTDSWWYVLDSADLTVESPAAVAPGSHEVTVSMGLYIPYLPVDGAPLVSLDTCTTQLEVKAA